MNIMSFFKRSGAIIITQRDDGIKTVGLLNETDGGSSLKLKKRFHPAVNTDAAEVGYKKVPPLRITNGKWSPIGLYEGLLR